MSPEERDSQRVVVAVVYIAAMSMAIMDTTIVNVALPTIGRDFGAGPGSVDLVSIAYLVSLSVFFPVSGWLGDRLGARTALLLSVAIFTIASAACGLAGGLDELVALRVLQAFGGAVMTSVGLAMLFGFYPPDQRVRISSTVAVFTGLAPALGPVLGGLFTSYLSWRWVFFVNAPIGVAVMLAVAFGLPAKSHARTAPLDFAGLVASGLGLGALMYGVADGPQLGWTHPAVLAALVVGPAALLAMIAIERRASHPLISLDLFHDRLFSTATAMYALSSVSYLGSLYLVALFYQDLLGLTPVQSGLLAVPSAIGIAGGAQLVTRRLYRPVGPRRIAVSGFVLIALSALLLAREGNGTPLWQPSAALFFLGMGTSFVYVPSRIISMATLPGTRLGQASSVFNAAKQIGSAAGVALVSSFLATLDVARGGMRADVGPFHTGFLAVGAVAVASIAVALTIRDRDAAATMQLPAPGSHHDDTVEPAMVSDR